MSNLLSQGGFGCVYYPGLKCDNEDDNKKNDNDKFVTKLQKKNFTSNNELNIGLTIKKNEFYKFFFLPVVSQCPVNIKVYKKKHEEQLKECDVIKDDDKKYMLMKIPYVKNKPVVEAIFNETNDKKHLMISIMELYTASLKAIGILIEKKIVHFDLKSDNILYDTQLNHMKFIDFGLSIPIEKLEKENLKDYFYIYAPEYFVWPLEVHVINFLIHEYDGTNVDKKYVDNISNKIATEYVENNKGLNMFSREFRSKYMELCVLQIKKYLKTGNKNTIINNLIKYYETWDNYSISITLLRIVDLLFPNEFVENMFYEVFSQLLLYNIHPNPLKRFNISETFNKYYEIFYLNENVETYFEAFNSIDIDFDKGIETLNKENDLLNNSIKKTIY
ncbi:MAG: hypothetical protein CMD14_02845 [Flavobacteriales bacterium]|nr:hypothetical protein [Flavobacteriales bacterium]